MAFVSAASDTLGGGTGTKTLTAPGSISAGNVLVAAFVFHLPTAISTRPTGWANAITREFATTGTLIVEYKVADIGDESATTYDWEVTVGSGGGGGIVQHSGRDETTPIDSSNSNETSSGTSHTTPEITPTVDNCTILTFFAMDASAAETWSGGGDNERIDLAGTFGTVLGVYDTDQTTAAAISKTGTSSATEPAGTAIVALAPVAAAASGNPYYAYAQQ